MIWKSAVVRASQTIPPSSKSSAGSAETKALP
jgi:hypothetical protein